MDSNDAKLLRGVASGVLTILIVALLVLVIIPKLNRSPDSPLNDSLPRDLAANPVGRDTQADQRDARPKDSVDAGKDGETQSPAKDSIANKQEDDSDAGKQPASDANSNPPPTELQVERKPTWLDSTLAKYRQVRKFAVSADGRVIVTYAIDDPNRSTNVKIELVAWDLGTGEKLHTLTKPGITTAMAVSHDGRYVATTGRGTPGPVAFRLWNIETGKLVQTFKVLVPDTWIGFSADKNTAWCFVPKQGLFTLDLATGQSQLFADMPDTASEAGFSHTHPVAILKHNTLSGRQWLDVFQLKDKGASGSIHDGSIGSFALSPDGKTVAIGHRGEIKLFDAATGRESRSLSRPGMKLAPVTLQISHDNRYMLEVPFGADGSQPAIWNLDSNNRRQLDAGDASTAMLCKRCIVVLDKQHHIRLFELETGEPITIVDVD